MSTSSTPEHALRLGVAGLGFGAGVHLPIFCGMADVDVCAILGRDRAKTESVAKTFGVAAPCVTLEEFLDRDLDAIVVSLPPEPAGVAAAAALERGLAVFAEKPIAATAEAAKRLAARGAGCTTIVDFEFRELLSFQTLKKLLDEGAFGRVSAARISWRSLSYLQRRRTWSWKCDADRGGGILMLSGLHLFNLFEWLFGRVTPEAARFDDRATRAFAPEGGRPAADTADLVLRTADGAPIEAHLTNVAPDRLGHRWEIETERGRLTLEDAGGGAFSGFTLAIAAAEGKKILAEDPPAAGDYRMAPVAALAARFVAAARTRATVAPAFDEGARSQEILETVGALDGAPMERARP